MDWSTYSGNLKWLPTSTIFVTLHGSHAYGTNIPTSDVDLRGVCVPPRNYLYGMERFEQMVQTEPDMQVFGLQKFFLLAAACNPNVLECLYTERNDWRHLSVAGQRLIDMRDEFLSQRAAHTFSGYAVAQLKRIKTHREWLLNPPKGAPTRASFGLSDDRQVSKEQLGAYEALVGLETQKVEFSDELLTLLIREKQYGAAKCHWLQYQNWLATRNPKRSELEAKHGYDTKHAMHLVRLMRMAEEIVSTGRVLVKRPDAEELLRIRAGDWSYDRLIEWADKQDVLVKAIPSCLVHHPDMSRLSELCVEITEIGWRDA